MFKGLCTIAVCVATSLTPVTARSQAAREATIEPETKAKIILQTRLSSKLSEVGDPITAVLDEPVYTNGMLVLQRGTEFHGRVAQITPAKRGQKEATMAVIFDRLAMPWGEEPVSVVLTAVDDWDKNEKLKADDEGKVKGGKKGKETAENVVTGGAIGGGAAGVILLSGGGGGAGAAALGGGMLAGLFLTKGKEVLLAPGAVFRIKFVKPLTLPVISSPGQSPVPQTDPQKVSGTNNNQ